MDAKRQLALITTIICFLLIIVSASSAFAEPVRVTGVRLDQGEITLFIGHDEFLNASVYPSNADNRTVRWLVSNSNVIEIIPDGRRARIIARSVGESYVTVITNDREYRVSCLVTVIIPVRSIGIDHVSITIKPDETFELKAAPVPRDATEQGIVWESSNPAIATVDQQGKVKGMNIGEARIIARSLYDERNIFAHTNVTVAMEAAAPVVSEEITNEETTNQSEENAPPIEVLDHDPPPESDNTLNYALIGLAAAVVIAAAILIIRSRNQGSVSGAGAVAGPHGQTRQAYLSGRTGTYAGQRFSLSQGPVVIGRDPAQASVLYPQAVTQVSRRHCTVSYDPASQTFILQDSSSNGTFLGNGEQLAPGQPYYLQSGSTFSLVRDGETFSVELE